MTLHLNDLSQIYLDQISEKKDDSYLETDMKKRQKNNEKAISDMKKVKDDTKPRWMREGKKLDPVGQEDADIDNDGDVDKSDKYLHKKRKAIGKAISKNKDEEDEKENGDVEEGFKIDFSKRFKNEAERNAYIKKTLEKSKEKQLNKLKATTEEVESVNEKINVTKQSSKRKSLGRGSSINPDAKKTGYESPSEFRKTEKKLAPYTEAKNVHGEVEVPSKDIKKLVKNASNRIDFDVDGDVENNDNSKGKYGEFVSTSDGKGRLFTGPKKVTKESVSNWRQDLIEVADEDGEKQIKEMPKNQKNKIKINPNLGEAVEKIDGTLLEEVEIDELDVIINTIYEEFFEEGYTEDEIEEAFEVVLLDEASVTYGHDTSVSSPKKQSKLQGRMRYIKRKVGEKLSKIKSKAKEKFGMASAKAQVSAYNKARELSQKASDVKNRSKTSLKRFVGKQAQKVADRMKEEVDIDESIQSEVQVTPQEVQLQRKSASIDKKLASIRQRKVQKQTSTPAKSMNEGTTECVHSIKGKECPVHGKKDCSSMDEATEDSLRDRRMERGGVDGNNRYDKAPGKPNTFGKKPSQKYDGMSALEKVKASIRAKHGQGAIKEDVNSI